MKKTSFVEVLLKGCGGPFNMVVANIDEEIFEDIADEYYVERQKQEQSDGTDVIVKLKLAMDGYVKLFETKHNLTFYEWVGDLTGTLAFFSEDYYVMAADIRADIELNAPVNSFFKWYKSILEPYELGYNASTNYIRFLNKRHIKK